MGGQGGERMGRGGREPETESSIETGPRLLLAVGVGGDPSNDDPPCPLPPAKAGLREGKGSDGCQGLECSFFISFTPPESSPTHIHTLRSRCELTSRSPIRCAAP